MKKITYFDEVLAAQRGLQYDTARAFEKFLASMGEPVTS